MAEANEEKICRRKVKESGDGAGRQIHTMAGHRNPTGIRQTFSLQPQPPLAPEVGSRIYSASHISETASGLNLETQDR